MAAVVIPKSRGHKKAHIHPNFHLRSITVVVLFPVFETEFVYQHRAVI
jgi:hypothetical protein